MTALRRRARAPTAPASARPTWIPLRKSRSSRRPTAAEYGRTSGAQIRILTRARRPASSTAALRICPQRRLQRQHLGAQSYARLRTCCRTAPCCRSTTTSSGTTAADRSTSPASSTRTNQVLLVLGSGMGTVPVPRFRRRWTVPTALMRTGRFQRTADQQSDQLFWARSCSSWTRRTRTRFRAISFR